MVEIRTYPASITVCPKCKEEDMIVGDEYEEGEEIEVTCGKCGHKYKDTWHYDQPQRRI